MLGCGKSSYGLIEESKSCRKSFVGEVITDRPRESMETDDETPSGLSIGVLNLYVAAFGFYSVYVRYLITGIIYETGVMAHYCRPRPSESDTQSRDE